MAVKAGSVSLEALQSLQQQGITSPMLEARLAYTSAQNLLSQHLNPLVGKTRCYPNLMNPQSSGRVGTAKPPIGNFTASKKYGPHGIRDVVHPDPGEQWVCFDWEAVEARIIGHACQDPVDKEAFDRGYDIHTVTGIRMFRWPDPPFEPTKDALWATDEGREWCGKVAVLIGERDSEGRLVPYDDSCRTRRLVKNCRYALQYALNEKAMGRYAIEMRMKKKDLWHFGKLYLDSKPWLTSWKRRTWADCWRTHEARTAFGRRRKLVGKRNSVMKEGLNHQIQGTVADLMKLTIVAVCQQGAQLVYQTHDGAKFIWAGMVEALKPYVEREWVLWGRSLFIPASWEVICSEP